MSKTSGQNLISGLIRKRSEISGQLRVAKKAANLIQADIDAIDRTLELVGYKGNPRSLPPKGKHKMMFGRSELKRTITDQLRSGPKDDRAIVDHIIESKGWEADDELTADILKRVRHAIQRLRNADHVEQDFGPDGALWRILESGG